MAQETGLQCACAFVEFGGRPAATAAKAVFTTALVEKNILGSARAGSKKAAVELCLVLVECEGNADTVFEACIEGLKSKQPKAVAGAVLVMKEIVRYISAQPVNFHLYMFSELTYRSYADNSVPRWSTSNLY